MLLALLLSLHILLILIYAIAIETKKSRHSYVHLLFAAVVPLVGELCLFASEFGKADADFSAGRLFRYEKQTESTTDDEDLPYSLPVTREILLKALETKPKNLVAILKDGISAEDIEVVHISAATMMKLQREYENRISALREEYRLLEDDMAGLKEYIAVVGAYYASGLLEGEAAQELLTLQESLLKKLLRVLPEDLDGTVTYIENLRAQGRTQEALSLCESYRKTHHDFAIWQLNDALLADGDQRAALRREAAAVFGEWEPEQIRLWNRGERS